MVEEFSIVNSSNYFLIVSKLVQGCEQKLIAKELSVQVVRGENLTHW